MKKILLMIELILASIMLVSCADVSNCNDNVGSSSLFNKKEMDTAINVAKDYFWKNYDGSILNSIEYDDKLVISDQISLTKMYSVDYALIFTLWYYDSKDQIDNDLQHKNFILGSNENKYSWTVLDAGYY